MKIAIPTLTTTDRVTGVAEYLINLLDGLQRLDSNNTYYIFTSLDNRHMFKITSPNFTEIILPLRHKPWLLMRSLYHLWQLFVFPIWCRCKAIDVVHLPNTLFVPPCPPAITTVHDIAELKTAKYSRWRTLMRRAMILSIIRYSRSIIADSESTRRDLIAMNASHVRTVHLGFTDPYSKLRLATDTVRMVLDKFALTGCSYVIFVGTIMRHKNLPNLIRSFAVARRSAEGLKLVIVGAPDNAYDEVIATIRNESMADHVKLLDYVSYEEKQVLVKNAAVSVLISSYEGFGIPVLESQAAGIPIIISNLSSLPEIAGDGAIAVNPGNIEEISQAMLACLADADLRNALVRGGFENIRRFSWERCARETLEIYEETCRLRTERAA